MSEVEGGATSQPAQSWDVDDIYFKRDGVADRDEGATKWAAIPWEGQVWHIPAGLVTEIETTAVDAFARDVVAALVGELE